MRVALVVASASDNRDEGVCAHGQGEMRSNIEESLRYLRRVRLATSLE